MTQRFDSYFVLIKFSILLSEGTCPGANFASQYVFARAFPHFTMLANCSSVQASRSTDLTLLMCVPKPLWIPEHRMQTKTPRFQLAHLGSESQSSVSIHAKPISIVLAAEERSLTFIALAISTDLIVLSFQESFDRRLIFGSVLSYGTGFTPPGHDPGLIS